METSGFLTHFPIKKANIDTLFSLNFTAACCIEFPFFPNKSIH